jgi:ATP-dependent DNA ligase
MFWQYKYNGHRCLITRRDDCLLAYSRNGKHIGTIDHIFDGLEIPEGATLDGELYIHNTPLQTISSIVRRKQPDNTKLKYIVYDTILDKRFEDRLDTLAKYKMGPDVLVAPTIRCPLREMLTKQGIHDEAHAKGFEGFMLRMNNKKYEPGKRSSQLLKVKQAFDIEVVVIGVEPSVDGWAILICKFVDKHGIIKTFRTPAPGTMRQKTEILHNKENYINKLLNVEFAEYTIDGIPFHPVATSFREEE